VLYLHNKIENKGSEKSNDGGTVPDYPYKIRRNHISILTTVSRYILFNQHDRMLLRRIDSLEESRKIAPVFAELLREEVSEISTSEQRSVISGTSSVAELARINFAQKLTDIEKQHADTRN
jgi:histidyl-tRNA synthetase